MNSTMLNRLGGVFGSSVGIGTITLVCTLLASAPGHAQPDADEVFARNRKLGVEWRGTPDEQAAVTRDFDKVQAWATKQRRPIHQALIPDGGSSPNR
jgi:hypothetical protein